MRVLGIETSCDETGVAIYDAADGLVAHAVHTQSAIHAGFGGVVPELASRDHVRRLPRLARRVLEESGSRSGDIDGVAYTAGPGLVGALMVGTAFGRSLAWAWGVPALGVHHMEGHLLAPMLEPDPPTFPFLALLVSGGHTQLVEVGAVGAYRLLGESIDDAAGEAFDKVATLLGLPYPGGPALAELARGGDPGRFRFPRPMTDRPGFDFSFSGLKTHALSTLAREGRDRDRSGHGDGHEAGRRDDPLLADVARAFEDAVVDTLVIKCRRALRATGLPSLVVSGGVGANRRLRTALADMARGEGAAVSYPRPELCTDNGAMIAYAGCCRLLHGADEPRRFGARARWALEELGPPGSGAAAAAT